MVPYLRAANVKDGYLDLDDVKEMNFSPAEQLTFSLHPGDVLVTEGAGSLAAVGAAAVWSAEIKGTVCFQNTLLRLRPRGSTDPRFLLWWARHAYSSGLFASIASGANIYHLSAERVRSLRTWIPATETQVAIADLLNQETTTIDSLIAAKRRMMELLEQRAAVLHSSLLTPPGVHMARLGYFASVQTGLTVDANRERDGAVGEYPYLRVANVQAGWLHLHVIKTMSIPDLVARQAMLQPGDVLMTEGGDLDKLGRGTVWDGQIPGCLHQNHIFAVRADRRRLDPAFLALLTRTNHARAYFESTGVRTTNLASTSSSKILDFPIPVLPVAQQRELVRTVEAQTRPLQELRAALGRQVSLLKEQQQTLITAAVAGQLDVSATAA